MIGKLARPLAAALLATALAGCAAAPAGPGTTLSSSEYLDAARGRPPLLRAFLHDLPKGAELHTHLSGAVYAESYLAWAMADGLCVDAKAMRLVLPAKCDADTVPAARIAEDGHLRSQLLRALSTGYFLSGDSFGHDQFFDAFARFTAQPNRLPDMLAEVVGRAADQHVQHIELMLTLQSHAIGDLAETVGWTDDLDAQRTALLAAGLGKVVAAAGADADAALAAMRRRLGCESDPARPACTISVRLLQQVNRTSPPRRIFAEMVTAFELAARHPAVAGLNLVAPEDAMRALDDYALHMRMLAALRPHYPQVHLALHAGELRLGLVPPTALADHIRSAIEVAGAERIGHGVDIMSERDPFGLLAEMAARKTLVEVALTSNRVILGVAGTDHPFPVYLRAGVPVTLSTDDEGVSRIDLTHEYQLAVETYGLSYDQLKTLSRNGLEYSFLKGPSLWADAAAWRPVEACRDPAAPACAALAAGSDKATRQLALERAWAEFDQRRWPAP